ncbi:unnamed protein product [Closterium sp. NIES-65]|nr:unnamed protein product [Closterium sp. NIES-65]
MPNPYHDVLSTPRGTSRNRERERDVSPLLRPDRARELNPSLEASFEALRLDKSREGSGLAHSRESNGMSMADPGSRAESLRMGHNGLSQMHPLSAGLSDVMTGMPLSMDFSMLESISSLNRTTGGHKHMTPGKAHPMAMSSQRPSIRVSHLDVSDGSMSNLERALEYAKKKVDDELRVFISDIAKRLNLPGAAPPRTPPKSPVSPTNAYPSTFTSFLMSPESSRWEQGALYLKDLAEKCLRMHADEFGSACEDIVHDLNMARQQLPMGTLKQLHMKMLFILTRCTRLLQSQKEAEAEMPYGGVYGGPYRGAEVLATPMVRNRPPGLPSTLRSQASMAATHFSSFTKSKPLERPAELPAEHSAKHSAEHSAEQPAEKTRLQRQQQQPQQPPQRSIIRWDSCPAPADWRVRDPKAEQKGGAGLGLGARKDEGKQRSKSKSNMMDDWSAAVAEMRGALDDGTYVPGGDFNQEDSAGASASASASTGFGTGFGSGLGAGSSADGGSGLAHAAGPPAPPADAEVHGSTSARGLLWGRVAEIRKEEEIQRAFRSQSARDKSSASRSGDSATSLAPAEEAVAPAGTAVREMGPAADAEVAAALGVALGAAGGAEPGIAAALSAGAGAGATGTGGAWGETGDTSMAGGSMAAAQEGIKGSEGVEGRKGGARQGQGDVRREGESEKAHRRGEGRSSRAWDVRIPSGEDERMESRRHGGAREPPSPSGNLAEDFDDLHEKAMMRSVSGRRVQYKYGYWGKGENEEEEGMDGMVPNEGEQECVVICRICEEEVNVTQLQEHSRLCALANRCDSAQFSIDDRLRRLADGLDHISNEQVSRLGAMSFQRVPSNSSSAAGGPASSGVPAGLDSHSQQVGLMGVGGGAGAKQGGGRFLSPLGSSMVSHADMREGDEGGAAEGKGDGGGEGADGYEGEEQQMREQDAVEQCSRENGSLHPGVPISPTEDHPEHQHHPEHPEHQGAGGSSSNNVSNWSYVSHHLQQQQQQQQHKLQQQQQQLQAAGEEGSQYEPSMSAVTSMSGATSTSGFLSAGTASPMPTSPAGSVGTRGDGHGGYGSPGSSLLKSALAGGGRELMEEHIHMVAQEEIALMDDLAHIAQDVADVSLEDEKPEELLTGMDDLADIAQDVADVSLEDEKPEELLLTDMRDLTDLLRTNNARFLTIDAQFIVARFLFPPLLCTRAPLLTPLSSLHAPLLTPLSSLHAPLLTPLSSLHAPLLTPLSSLHAPLLTPLSSLHAPLLTPLSSLHAPLLTPLSSLHAPLLTPLLFLLAPLLTPVSSLPPRRLTPVTSLPFPHVASLLPCGMGREKYYRLRDILDHQMGAAASPLNNPLLPPLEKYYRLRDILDHQMCAAANSALQGYGGADGGDAMQYADEDGEDVLNLSRSARSTPPNASMGGGSSIGGGGIGGFAGGAGGPGGGGGGGGGGVAASSSSASAAGRDRTTIDDFELIKPISKGAYGRVFLAKKKTTGDLFAIKVLRKADMVRKNAVESVQAESKASFRGVAQGKHGAQERGGECAGRVLRKADMVRKNAVESVQAERNILASVRSPFVVRCFYSFTCRENLYLVMEYLNGGDLFSLLQNLGCLEEPMARAYIAELVLALEHLHASGIIHRDLKPDNLLIAYDGHIKLTDFGLSQMGLFNSTGDFAIGPLTTTGPSEPPSPNVTAAAAAAAASASASAAAAAAALSASSHPPAALGFPKSGSIDSGASVSASIPTSPLWAADRAADFPPAPSGASSRPSSSSGRTSPFSGVPGGVGMVGGGGGGGGAGGMGGGSASPAWKAEVESLQGAGRSASADVEKKKEQTVGTPDYLAPEILLGTGHGATADWWAVGVMLFELLCGVPPFNAPSPEIIFDNILNRDIPWPEVPEEMSYEAMDLIDKLLHPEPSLRLGARGAEEVKAHPFFDGIRWETLAQEQAVFVPSPDNPHDTGYFLTRGWQQEPGGMDGGNMAMGMGESESASSDACSSTSADDFYQGEQGDEPGDMRNFSDNVAAAFTNFSFKNLSQLAEINYEFLGRQKSPPSHLKTMKRRGAGLILDLPDEVLTSIILESLLRRCSALEDISVINDRGKSTVGDELLLAVGSRCSQLERLSLVGCEGVTDNGWRTFSAQCRALKALELRLVSAKAVCPPLSAFPSLLSLTLYRLDGLPVQISSLSHCSFLTSLSLWHLTDPLLSSLSSSSPSLPALQSFTLTSASVTTSLGSLGAFPLLSSLALCQCSQIGPPEMHSLSCSLHTLTHLTIQDCHMIPSSAVAALTAANSSIVSLSLRGNRRLFSHVGIEAALKSIAGALESLTLSGMPMLIPDALAGCTRLKSLGLEYGKGSVWDIAGMLGVGSIEPPRGSLFAVAGIVIDWLGDVQHERGGRGGGGGVGEGGEGGAGIGRGEGLDATLGLSTTAPVDAPAPPSYVEAKVVPLESLSLHCFEFRSDVFLSVVSTSPFPPPPSRHPCFRAFTELRRLSLHACSGLEGRDFHEIFQSCPRLEHLLVDYNDAFSDRVISECRLERLTRFSVVACPKVTAESIGGILGSFPKLRWLKVEKVKVTERARRVFLRAGMIIRVALKALDLRLVSAKAVCPPLSAFPSLLSLTFYRIDGLPVQISSLSLCSSLTSLSLWHLTDQLLSSLSPSSPSLSSLQSRTLKSASVKTSLGSLGAFPLLSSLALCTCSQIGPPEMHPLSRSLHTLTHLTIQDCLMISSSALAALTAANPSLASLSLQGSWRLFMPGVIEAALKSAAGALESLTLSGVPMLSQGMLEGCTRLKALRLEYGKGSVLDVAGTLQLSRLSLHTCTGLKESDFYAVLQPCPRVEHLLVDYNDAFSDRVISESRLESLTRFTGVACPKVTVESIGGSEFGGQVLSSRGCVMPESVGALMAPPGGVRERAEKSAAAAAAYAELTSGGLERASGRTKPCRLCEELAWGEWRERMGKEMGESEGEMDWQEEVGIEQG